MSEEEKGRTREEAESVTEDTNIASPEEKREEATAAPDGQGTAEAAAAAAEEHQRYVRLQADFANFKKRTNVEKLQLSELVKTEVLIRILPIMDNFERALQSPRETMSEEMQSFVAGYEMIYKQLREVLEKEGVTKMEAVGKPFDPQYHQAVMRVASDAYENDTVAEVLQEGYLLGDKTLRPAMVKVVFNG